MKILAVQNRMGIGDTVIFLPFIEAISKKFNVPVSLLVKKSSKADQYLKQTDYIDNIIFLERNNKKDDRHNGIIGSIRLAKELKKNKFDKIFIFNSSLRFNLIARLANIKEIYQYPLFKKTNQHIVEPAKNLIQKNLGIDIFKDPQIGINIDLIKEAVLKFNMKSDELNILLGIGGSGPTKRIPSKTFLSIMEKIYNFKKTKFFLATGKKDEEQKILNQILNSKFKDKCVSLDNLSITDTLPIIKNCNVSICNDSSFSHLSSALGIKTITLMADTPLIYGSYNSKMYPIIPDGETTVKHNTFGKDKINPDKIFDKFISIIN
ncbi:glycosyltransferase family 9 protein [Candidatus Pelagibacter sp.]|nr:glycosyltransferase family 9 protein [Candidatus Pelagibacter sp.]